MDATLDPDGTNWWKKRSVYCQETEMDETSLNPTPVDTQYVYIGAVF